MSDRSIFIWKFAQATSFLTASWSGSNVTSGSVEHHEAQAEEYTLLDAALFLDAFRAGAGVISFVETGLRKAWRGMVRSKCGRK